jgi:hypothetical protein
MLAIRLSSRIFAIRGLRSPGLLCVIHVHRVSISTLFHQKKRKVLALEYPICLFLFAYAQIFHGLPTSHGVTSWLNLLHRGVSFVLFSFSTLAEWSVGRYHNLFNGLDGFIPSTMMRVVLCTCVCVQFCRRLRIIWDNFSFSLSFLNVDGDHCMYF